MNVKYKNHSETLTLYLYGELDEYSSSNSKKILDSIILNNVNVKQVIIDLSGVTFMDSTGIGFLIGRYKTIKKFGVNVYLTGASISTEKVMQLAGLYSIMPKL